MTKHPQSEYGYAVNWVVVFQPPTRPVEESPKCQGLRADTKRQRRRALHENARKQHCKPGVQSRCQRRRALRENARKKHCKPGVQSRRQVTEAIARIQQLQVSNSTIANLMENLKNACKIGDGLAAREAAKQLSKNLNRFNKHHGEHFERCFFLPTIENREAVYYAAHSGQFQMLRLFLASWVVAKVHNSKAKRTILEWFSAVGFPVTYDESRFQVTVLNALSKEAEKIMLKEVYTLGQLKRIVRGSVLEERCAETATSDKKIKRPRLIVEDRFNTKFADVKLAYVLDEDTSHGSDEECDGDSDHLCMLSQGRDEGQADCIDSIENMNTCVLGAPMSRFSSSETLSEESNTDDANSVLEWCVVSDRIYVGDEDTAGMIGVDERDESGRDDWSVVSDLLSVRSIRTEGDVSQRTYAEVLEHRRGGSTFLAMPKPAMPALTEDPKDISDPNRPCEECCDGLEEFDADFLRDGYKQGRARKISLRFKGDKRTKS